MFRAFPRSADTIPNPITRRDGESNLSTANTKPAILLANLGSPSAPDEAAVREFLNEFLMDPYVIDSPKLIRRLVVSMILRGRPRESAAAYRSIWRNDEPGSPLRFHTEQLADAVAARYDGPVAVAMRYGEPRFEAAFADLGDDVLVIPLYPQHADSTRTTTIEHLRPFAERRRLRVIRPFFDDPTYLDALSGHLQANLPAEADHVLFSYHSLPERHLKKADPTQRHCLASADCCEGTSPAHATCYRYQCLATSKVLAAAIDTPTSTSFQSRLGRLPWLTPYTVNELERLATSGVEDLAVFCPAFIADNLETLEEIEIQGQATFRAAGGRNLHLIPCLNSSPALADTITVWAAAPEQHFDEL